VGKKKDIDQIDKVAKKFKMVDAMRKDFGDFLEACKARGERGSKNRRGDFTWAELIQKAKEYLKLEAGE